MFHAHDRRHLVRAVLIEHVIWDIVVGVCRCSISQARNATHAFHIHTVASWRARKRCSRLRPHCRVHCRAIIWWRPCRLSLWGHANEYQIVCDLFPQRFTRSARSLVRGMIPCILFENVGETSFWDSLSSIRTFSRTPTSTRHGTARHVVGVHVLHAILLENARRVWANADIT